MLEASRAPLFEALIQYMERRQHTFHVPGHKNGQVYAQELGKREQVEELDWIYNLLQDVMRYDVTEITGTDDLHQPTGAIRDAQELAAACFGAEQTYFLVNGTTVGNLALILTCCTQPGDLLIVQRNVHKSVLHGLMLAGARAVFVAPRIDKISGLAVSPTAETIRLALERYPEAKGVLLCNPNYYGMGTELRGIAELVHQHGKPLLVDEAHGAHYGLHPELPASALQSGADGVVQSTHKMLSSLTMSAMLHVQGQRIDRSLLQQRLAMVQSSSPSYPLMASLDASRRWVHTRGANAFTRGLAAAACFRGSLRQLPRFELLPRPSDAGAAYSTLDPFKVAVCDRTGELTGFDLQTRLEALGCVPEMADSRYVVLLFSLGSTKEDAEALLQAFRQIDKDLGRDPEELPMFHEEHSVRSHSPLELEVHHSALDMDDTKAIKDMLADVAMDSLVSAPVPFSLVPPVEEMRESVLLEAAEHRIAAEMIIPYPPGIPVVYPGETISTSVWQMLSKLSLQGAKCQGVGDPTLRTIQVLKNK